MRGHFGPERFASRNVPNSGSNSSGGPKGGHLKGDLEDPNLPKPGVYSPLVHFS